MKTGGLPMICVTVGRDVLNDVQETTTSAVARAISRRVFRILLPVLNSGPSNSAIYLRLSAYKSTPARERRSIRRSRASLCLLDSCSDGSPHATAHPLPAGSALRDWGLFRLLGLAAPGAFSLAG